MTETLMHGHHAECDYSVTLRWLAEEQLCMVSLVARRKGLFLGAQPESEYPASSAAEAQAIAIRAACEAVERWCQFRSPDVTAQQRAVLSSNQGPQSDR